VAKTMTTRVKDVIISETKNRRVALTNQGPAINNNALISDGKQKFPR
jgi:hypothetical protein